VMIGAGIRGNDGAPIVRQAVTLLTSRSDTVCSVGCLSGVLFETSCPVVPDSCRASVSVFLSSARAGEAARALSQ